VEGKKRKKKGERRGKDKKEREGIENMSVLSDAYCTLFLPYVDRRKACFILVVVHTFMGTVSHT
jgi:hypothetical protein